MMLTCPARPYEFKYDTQQTALFIIDFQKDFLLPGGFGDVSLGNDVSLLQRAVAPTREVLQAARQYGLAVYHFREGYKPDLSDCHESKRNRGRLDLRIGDRGPMGRILIRGEPGNEIIDELAPLDGEPVIDKPGKNAFYATDLDARLRSAGTRYLVLTGVTTEVCDLATIIGANDHGYEPLLLEDCVASYKPALHAATIEMVVSQDGILGWVAQSKEFLDSLRTAHKE